MAIDMMNMDGPIVVLLREHAERLLWRQAVGLLTWRLAQIEVGRIEKLPASPRRATILRALRGIEKPEIDALQLLVGELE